MKEHYCWNCDEPLLYGLALCRRCVRIALAALVFAETTLALWEWWTR